MSEFIYCYAECRYAECCNPECRYAECRYAECYYAECYCAECRNAECHYTDDDDYVECRGTTLAPGKTLTTFDLFNLLMGICKIYLHLIILWEA